MQAIEIGALRVRAALALGRHAEALTVMGRTRRGRRLFALEAAHALLELMRPREALRVATRALQAALPGSDCAGLRVARARALWQMGATRRAAAEAARAADQAGHDLARARALEVLAHIAWKDQRLDEAGRLAGEALAAYERARHPEGIAACLEVAAGSLRDAGRFEEALHLFDRRVEAAATTTRVDQMALAHADRGDLLAFVGRFDEAARELDTALDFFRRLGDEREHSLARPRRAIVDLARGDLAAVRRALDRARECAFDAPRLRGEHHLLASDLQLAAGDPASAEAEAGEALQAFGSVGSRAGASRSRVRRALALLAQGRAAEARLEAARAVREAPPARADLTFLALLVLGRAELRRSTRVAADVFEKALRVGDSRPGPMAAARLGVLVARGRGGSDPEVARELKTLEAWGDRRLLAYGLADLGLVAGAGAVPAAATASRSQPAAPPAGPPPCGDALRLSAAAEALLRGASWPARFAAALQALRGSIGFHRAAWVGPGALELGPDGVPRALAEDDLARQLGVVWAAPALLDLDAEGLSRHPSCVLHDLRQAAVVPVTGERSWLYVDFRARVSPSVLAALRPLVPLLAAAAEAGVELEPIVEREFPGLLGRCEAMRHVRETIARVGPSGLAVHVFGETGTGKEKVAGALHAASGRRGRLVCVNAAQLEDGLFDSELFGHVKGAFTGAVADREGFVAAAQAGSLFLDEVAELSPRAQAKLLRFLETGEYVRVGESRPRRADVRILSAANAALRERVAEQRFREDLMYRLTDFTITLPPLRERGEDVLLLARHFLAVHAAREKLACPRLGGEAARALRAHPFPGNVRELVKQMHRAVVLARGGAVHAELLQLQAGHAGRGSATLRDARAAFERELVGRYLAAHGGCRTRAADALGITRQALALKMRQYGLT